MLEPSSAQRPGEAEILDAVRASVDPILLRFLADRRAELGALDPAASVLVDELVRLIEAGGKRIRPALCYWSFRTLGGRDGEPILAASAALELLHTSALVHDDVMDRDDERRGVPATHARFAKDAPPGTDPDAFGTAAAILVGDLALVLSEQMLRTSGFDAVVLSSAMSRFDRMRTEMAAGQFLDVAGATGPRVRALKSASYTVEGPVLIGAALSGAEALSGSLVSFGRLVGEAFQLRDDVLDGDDGDRGGRARHEIDALVAEASRAVSEDRALSGEGAHALARIAELLRLRESS